MNLFPTTHLVYSSPCFLLFLQTVYRGVTTIDGIEADHWFLDANYTSYDNNYYCYYNSLCQNCYCCYYDYCSYYKSGVVISLWPSRKLHSKGNS